MTHEALFINGVYESVLEKILETQSVLPDQILFLQPYSARPIVDLQKSPPSVNDPMRLFLSTTTDLSTVRYQGEIVGWDDKRTLPSEKRNLIEKIINLLQREEGGLYNASLVAGGESLNLLHVRRLEKLKKPFSVERLVKVTDGDRLSPNRSMAGGWSYVGSDPVPES
jgi:hypothetical protein